MSDEWIGVVNAAAPKYLKGAADLTVRKRLALSMLEKRGKVTLNYRGSHETQFAVDYKEPPVESFGSNGTITYEARDYLKRGTIDWRGYVANDFMTLKEYEETRSGGEYVIVDRYKRIFPKLTKAVRNKIGLELYIDGNAAGNENRFCGLNSFCGAGTVAAGDIVAVPDDTYFGLDTDVHQAGTWTANLATKPNSTIAYDWPEGEGDAEFDFWSPKLINTSSTGWGTGSTSWQDNCEKVMRRAIQWLSLTAGVEGRSLLCILNGQMLTQVKDYFSARQRVLVPHKEANDLGFPDVLNFEGLALQAEYGCPANTGFIVNLDETELCILPNELIKSEGPMRDQNTLGYKFAVYTFGNFKFSPKTCAKLYPYA